MGRCSDAERLLRCRALVRGCGQVGPQVLSQRKNPLQARAESSHRVFRCCANMNLSKGYWITTRMPMRRNIGKHDVRILHDAARDFCVATKLVGQPCPPGARARGTRGGAMHQSIAPFQHPIPAMQQRCNFVPNQLCKAQEWRFSLQLAPVANLRYGHQPCFRISTPFFWPASSSPSR